MEKEKYIKEKNLLNMPKAIPIGVLEFLIPKSKESVCKIYCSDNGHGTGFFCNIPNNWSILKVLMTNNHVLNENDISIGHQIKFSINNEMKYYNILIDKSRKVYTSIKYDITIIELKPNDKLEDISFFDIDNQLFKENLKEIFNKRQLYLLHYPKGKEIEYSIGLIQNISEDNYTIRHLCDSSEGSSGGPLINSINFQVIGIHKGGAEGAQNYNLGTFLKEPIEEYIGKNNICKIDENENNNSENVKEIINKKNNKDDLINEDIDQIIIQYKIEDIEYSKNIRIFGDNFVENNKDKCKIIIKGNEFELSTHININKKQLNNKILELKLKGIQRIIDMSSMFKAIIRMHPYEYEYIPLSSLPDISKWNTKNITDMSSIFYGCKLLSSLSDISKWNTKNVNNMSSMFYGCELLSSLPDISKWDTQNVTKMGYILSGCKLLSSLPDLSKWNTKNVTDMSSMFCGCSSLALCPDISNWNTLNVTDMNGIFCGCSSLSSLPDISKWDVKNVSDMDHMFSGCSLLTSLPDISKWNTMKLTYIEAIFKDCSTLLSLPDISKWNTENVEKMGWIFTGCSSLSFLPDISKWNTKKVTDMCYMFSGCSSLSSLPDISKWDVQNVYDMKYMFSGCSLLTSLPDISKWNTMKMTYIEGMFSYLSSLSSLPDISKWNTENLRYKTDMFKESKKLVIPKKFEKKKKKKDDGCIIL